MHDTHLGKMAMSQYKNLDRIASEQYDIRKSKAAEIQALTTRLFYDITRKNRILVTSIFLDLVSNYDMVVHSIASLSLQRVDAPKEPIICTFNTIQNVNHSVKT